MSAVREDRDITSADVLSDEDLRDHLDEMLIKLARRLARGDAPETEAVLPEREAGIHGALRSQQNYRADELVREVGVLRSCFLELFSEFLREKRQIETVEFLQITQIVHRFFDEICTESVSAYVRQREQQAESTAEALRRLNANLEEANRQYEHNDSFRRRTLRAVAHDMATPVNALGLGVSFLSESEDPVEREEARQLVSRTLQHLRVMLDQLLDFGRMEGGLERLKVSEFSAEPLFEYLLSAFEPLASVKGLDLNGYLDPALGVLRSDENKIQRIAVNLLANAIKYTDEGRIDLALRADGDNFVLEVSDTGCGIPDSEQERIFAEFQRLPSHLEQPGLGLGLAIVRTLTHRLQGTVALQSAEGHGSKFTVVLPRQLS